MRIHSDADTFIIEDDALINPVFTRDDATPPSSSPAKAGLDFLRPGVGDLLRAFDARGVPWGVVTALSRQDAFLGFASWGVFPDVLIAADDTRTPEPSPVGFRLAARHLGVPTRDATAVVATRTGHQAALLAGCLPVLLTPTRPLDSLLREGRPRPVSSLLAALFHARATRGASLWALFDVFVDSGLAITRDVATGTSAPERRRVPRHAR